MGPKQIKRNKMRLIRLLGILSVLSLASCNSLPPPPDAYIYSHDVSNRSWLGVYIPDSVAQNPNPKTRVAQDSEIAIGFDSTGWENIQIYIEKLKEIAKNQCK